MQLFYTKTACQVDIIRDHPEIVDGTGTRRPRPDQARERQKYQACCVLLCDTEVDGRAGCRQLQQ